MSLFRLIEGIISTRETRVLPYTPFDQTIGPATDRLIDFGGLRKDIHIQNNRTIGVKFDSTANPIFYLGIGDWSFTEQYAGKMYVTTTVSTELAVLANG